MTSGPSLLMVIANVTWMAAAAGVLVWVGLKVADSTGTGMVDARTHLPWTLAGRRVRPYALAASLASATLAAVILTDSSVWGDPGDGWSLAVAGIAAASTVLLWVGFWARSNLLMRHGLLLSAAVFAARGAYIVLVSGNWWTGALSLCWTLSSGGAYLLEHAWDRSEPPGRGAPP